MSVFKSSASCFFAATLLNLALCIGCASPEGIPNNVTSIPPAEPAVTEQAVIPEAPIVSAPAPLPLPPPASPAQTNSIPPLPRVTGDWVSLREWLARVNLPAPIRTAEGGAVTFIVQSGTNAFRFNPGNTLMRLNKMQCWLGFAPKLIGDNLYLHVIDLEKSLYPLAFPRSSPQLSGLIMIDPGHGGDHPGTKSVFENKFEKDYTLDWALRTQRILQQRGYRVVLTRTNDSDIPIPERILMADRLNASLFISLHFNSAFPNVEQAGIETFCLTPMGSSSHLTRGYDDDVRTSLPNNQQDAANLQLAARVHQHLLASTQANDRGIRRARFMAILRTQRRPALLIEAGYLSNPREARLIADATYRQKLAEGLANALSDRTVADTR